MSMLASINVENFKSFEKRTELTMLSSTKIKSKTNHRIKIGSKTRLLKHAVIYGANASGKSNLIEFFQFFKETLKNGLQPWSMKFFCRNCAENEKKDSVFELQIEIDGKFYAYGFSAQLAKRKITGEWLYALYQNGSSNCIYEREFNSKPKLGDSIQLSHDEQMRFDTYSADFEDNNTDLFLSEMNRGKKYPKESPLRILVKIYNWIRYNIIILTPDSHLTDFQYYYDDASLALINELITKFDTGISSIRIEKIDMSELAKMLPEPILDDLLIDIREKLSSSGVSSIQMSGRTDRDFFSIKVDGDDEPEVTTIKMHHGQSIYDFSFSDESDGTRRLFDLIDMVLGERNDIVFLVDELERSLHPKLTEHFIKLFSKMHSTKKNQLIFTTHEATIMDQALFRRDEIWFVERDKDNNSFIYSLDRFKERYDKKLSKAYLEGRYGAIPVFKDFCFGKDN